MSQEERTLTRYKNYFKRLKQVQEHYFFVIESSIASLLLSPLYVISLSRQLSVPAHKGIYGDFDPAVKSSGRLLSGINIFKRLTNQYTGTELTVPKTDLTLREKRNTDLIKSSGMPSGQKPYRAPIYDSYWDTVKALNKQGILGFYKGNAYRLVYLSGILRFKITLDWVLLEREYLQAHLGNFLRDIITLTLAEMAFHPCLVIETRYTLQNRLPQFRAYDSIMKIRSRSFHELFNGILIHLPKNILFFSSLYSVQFLSNVYRPIPWEISFLFSLSVVYPLMTCLRRIVCQTTQIPGMIPLRYLNLLHALVLIKKEEGIVRGWYKGFSAYLLACALFLIYVPPRAKFMGARYREQEFALLEDDPIYETIRTRRINESLA